MPFRRLWGARARPLATHFGVPHGKANALRLAEVFGENVSGLSVREARLKAVAAIQTLFKETDLPARLSDYGIAEADLDRLTKDSAASGSCVSNPRVPNERDIRAIFASVL